MKQGKILVVTPGYLPLLGGMEEQCYLLAKEFLTRGYAVDVLTEQTFEKFAKEEEIENAHVYRLKKPNRANFLGYLNLAKDLFVFLNKNKKYDFIIIRTFTFHGLFLGFLKYIHFLKIKTFITADTGGENDELDFLNRSAFRKFFTCFFKAHDFINSIAEINYVKLIKLGFPAKKITKISNGVDCGEYPNSCYPKKISNFLFLAQLKKEKGIYELLEAFGGLIKKYPNVKLYIGGDGPEKQNIVNYIDDKFLSQNIFYLGMINRVGKKEFYQKGECLVLPSYSEGFGLVYAEAAVMKRFIIATEVADLRRNFGDNIVFCEKRNVKDLQDKLVWAIENFDKKNVNYDDVIKKVDIKKVASEILALMKP